MLFDRKAQSVVEWIVIVAVGITLAGVAIYQIFTTLSIKFNDMNTQIGS